MLQLISIPSH